MTVDEFIRAEVSRPFAWGETDCASTADRWVRLIAGFSPMAAYGRKHGGEDDARAWLQEPGGIAVAMNRVMRKAGFVKTKDPQPGDIGLLLLDRQTMAVAILGSRMWFAPAENGTHSRPPAHFWKAWKIV